MRRGFLLILRKNLSLASLVAAEMGRPEGLTATLVPLAILFLSIILMAVGVRRKSSAMSLILSPLQMARTIRLFLQDLNMALLNSLPLAAVTNTSCDDCDCDPITALSLSWKGSLLLPPKASPTPLTTSFIFRPEPALSPPRLDENLFLGRPEPRLAPPRPLIVNCPDVAFRSFQ